MKQKAKDPNIYVPKKVKREHLEQLAQYREELTRNPKLKSLFIEMTLNCNEHCRHCGSRCGDIKMEDQLTDDEILAMLERLKSRVPRLENGKPELPFLNVTGGEPLLRPDFCELMKKCHKLGYRWGMTSNGLLIDREMAKKLRDAGMSTVSISLDGLEESHDWFRQSKGGYKRALQAVENLLSQNFKNVMITTVVHKRNIGELEEIYQVVKATHCNTWRVINVEPIGRALDDAEIRLDTKDYQYLIDFIMKKRAADQELEVSYGCNHFLGLKRERELRSWYFLCAAGIYTAGIFYNGDIGGCLDIERRPETVMGNIRRDDFYEVWENGFALFRSDRAETSSTCKTCKHRRFCGGDGLHTWNFDTHEPRLCMYQELHKKL